MVCSALENSFVYVSFVQGHFVHPQVHLYSSCIVVKMKVILSLQLLCYINFALACHRTIEKENYHQQDITLLYKNATNMVLSVPCKMRWQEDSSIHSKIYNPTESGVHHHFDNEGHHWFHTLAGFSKNINEINTSITKYIKMIWQ